MKKTLFTIFLGWISLAVFAQDRKDLSISIAAGAMNSPYYANAKKRPFYNFDFTYNLQRRHQLSTSYFAGKHFYYDNVLSNDAVPLTTPGYRKHTNAIADYHVFSLLYKYQLLNRKNISVVAGTGAGIMRQTLEYSYTQGTSSTPRQSGWSDLVFPVKLELEYKLSHHFKAGLSGGFFIHPDFPVLGYHAGPRLTYIMK